MQAHTDPPTRTNAIELDLDASVAAVVTPVCDRLGIRHWLKGQHLHSVMLDMVALDANGANEAELTAYGLALVDLARTLTTRPHDEKVLARLQLDADLADDHLRGIIAIDGESPTALDAYASALERSASLNLASARLARRKARRIRSTRSDARVRVGLDITGAA